MSEIRPDGDNQYRAINPPGNSNKEKAPVDRPEKDIKQITTATVRQKSVWTRAKESFTGDSAQSVGGYIVFDVVLPAMQQLVVDAFQQGVERLVLGDSRPNRARRTGERRHSNYQSHYQSSRAGDGARSQEPLRSREAHDFDELLIESRGEAEDVLDRLADLLEQYESVAVADLYRMVGRRPSHTDYRWGWTNLRSAQVRRVNRGYILELPTPIDLDRR